MQRIWKLIVAVVAILIILSLIPASIDWGKGFLDKNSGKPWAASSYYHLGHHAFRTMRFSKALEVYEDALRKFPRHPSAPTVRFRVAVCYEKLKRYREAIRAYKRFVDKHPQHLLANRARGIVKKLEGVHGTGR